MLRDKNIKKAKAKQRRHWSIRKKISGTPEKPRLVVFRSLKYTYAQLIDDTPADGSHTIEAVSTREIERTPDMKRSDLSFKIGEMIAEKAVAKGISKVCFDRAGYKYHGRVKAVAEGARKGGLVF